MTMSDLIRAQVDHMVDDWEAFARTRLPAAKGLDSRALRDHAKVMLLSFAEDIEQFQSSLDQNDKSVGALEDNSPELTKAAQDHAAERYSQGFTLSQMVAFWDTNCEPHSGRSGRALTAFCVQAGSTAMRRRTRPKSSTPPRRWTGW